MINPDQGQRGHYKLLEKAMDTLTDSTKAGAVLSDIYQAVKAVFKEEKDEEWVAKHLSPNFGHGIGFRHKDDILTISEDNTKAIEQGNVIFG